MIRLKLMAKLAASGLVRTCADDMQCFTRLHLEQIVDDDPSASVVD